MLSQNIEMMNYMNVPETVVIPERVKPKVQFAIHDFAVCLAILLIPVFTYCFFAGFNIQSEYKMQLVRSEVMALSRTNATTRMEVAQLEAPARIQKIAETKLGMKVATNAIYGGRDNRTAKVNIRD